MLGGVSWVLAWRKVMGACIEECDGCLEGCEENDRDELY